MLRNCSATLKSTLKNTSNIQCLPLIIIRSLSDEQLLDPVGKSSAMPSFGEARDALLFSLSEIKIIKDKEFLLLHDLNKSKNRDFEYWLFIEVNLQDVSDEHCLSEFRFTKNDRKKLRDALQLPLEIIYRLYNNNFADSGEASCILLRR